MCNFELMNYDGEEHALVSIIDITKIKLLEYDLEKKASIDGLTGVMNSLLPLLIKMKFNVKIRLKKYKMNLFSIGLPILYLMISP